MSSKKDKGKLLEIRAAKKAREPEFLRQDYGKVIGLERNWRKPRGLHSKMRLGRKGHRSNVSKGFRSPLLVRGLSKEGLAPVPVQNPNQVKQLDPSIHCIMLSGKTGVRKRVLILGEAVSRKIKVLNIKDPSLYINKVKEEMEARKKERTGKAEEKKKKKAELEKKAEEKEKEKKLEETLTDDEKKEKEKKEKDKLLTKKT